MKGCRSGRRKTAPLILLLLSFLAAGANSVNGGQTFRTRDPLRAFVRGDYPWGDDYFIHGNGDTILFRCLLVKERDGVDGLALSEVSIWGNHGGPWEIFRKSGKAFEYVGPGAVRDTSCLESCRSKDYLASGRCRWRRGWPDTPPVTQATPSPALVIDALSEAELSSAPFECDCDFNRGRGDGRTVVFATRGHRTRGLAKIDGTMVQLHLATKTDAGACRKGRRHEERWTDGSASVDLDAVVTGSGEEACWYRGRMTVTKGDRRERIAVTGSCGC